MTPALELYDNTAFKAATTRNPWPYQSFQPVLNTFPESLLCSEWPETARKHYCAWAVTRALGRIPLQVFHIGGLPNFCDTCPLCGDEYADVHHCLAICTDTRDLYVRWALDSKLEPHHSDWEILQHKIFSGRISARGEDLSLAAARINFVGSVFERISNAL